MRIGKAVHGYLYSAASQWLSLSSALLLSGIVLLFPNALMSAGEQPHHGLMSLAMLGISAGFVFGVGFIPRNRVIAWILGPCLAWPVMLLSYVFLIGVD
jgi:predicted membrane protein